MLCVQPASAIHWMVGRVNDADDGTQALGHTVIIYYPGDRDNCEVGTIGLEEGIDKDNYYMLSVEMIPNDEQFLNWNWISMHRSICIEIIDNGDGYVAGPVNVLIDTWHWTLVPTIQLRRI